MGKERRGGRGGGVWRSADKCSFIFISHARYAGKTLRRIGKASLGG